MNKLTTDLSKLTFIGESKLDHLVKLSMSCIDEEFLETILAEKNLAEYDIGIGTLYIGIQDSDIKYKFVPSDALKSALSNTLKTKRNLLEAKVEKSLVSCIENTYKDLLS